MVKVYANYEIILDFNFKTAVIGSLCALILPFCSVIGPVLESSLIELRDALQI